MDQSQEGQMNWRPVHEYAGKLHEWNELFGFGLASSQINDLVLPDHAGRYQPTSISLLFGRGLECDHNIVSQVLMYEFSRVGVRFDDYRLNYGMGYFPGSEHVVSGETQLKPTLLDIQRFWDPVNGFIPRDVRERFRGQIQPTFEVDWLVALNAELFVAASRNEIPDLLAPGLVVGSGGISAFIFHETEVGVDGNHYEGSRWYGLAIASFQEH